MDAGSIEKKMKKKKSLKNLKRSQWEERFNLKGTAIFFLCCNQKAIAIKGGGLFFQLGGDFADKTLTFEDQLNERLNDRNSRVER